MLEWKRLRSSLSPRSEKLDLIMSPSLEMSTPPLENARSNNHTQRMTCKRCFTHFVARDAGCRTIAQRPSKFPQASWEFPSGPVSGSLASRFCIAAGQALSTSEIASFDRRAGE